jgi:hypothetical protein
MDTYTPKFREDQQMPKVLTKIRIDECSAVTAGAGEGCVVKLIKRDGPAAPQTREQQLQEAASRYCAEAVAKSASTPANEYQAYRKRLFEAGPRTEPEPAPLVVNKAYDRLLAKAAKLAKADPSKTVEQHFEAVFTDSRYAELAKRAVRPASASMPRQGKTGLNPNDDDLDLDAVDTDPEDEEWDGDDVLPPGPDTDAATPTVGRSTSTYLNGSNTNQFPKPAVVGATEGSYNPRARGTPDRANGPGVVINVNPSIEKRIRKIMAQKPSISRVEATAIAIAPKGVRKAYKATLAS